VVTPEVWIGLVDLQPIEPDDPNWTEEFHDAAGAYCYAAALATSAPGFETAVSDELASYGWKAVSFDDAQTLEGFNDPSDELRLLGIATTETGDPHFATFHLYPKESLSTAEWLRSSAGDPDFSPTQKTVLEELAKMIEAVDPPLLDEGLSIDETEDGIELHLPHVDEDELDLWILVKPEGELTVDHGYGRLVFSEQEDGPAWLLDGYTFIHAALMGEVKVEIWEADGELEKSRTLVLAEDGEWEFEGALAESDGVSFDDPPTRTKVIDFTGEALGPGSEVG
jgi:hypothetical protein